MPARSPLAERFWLKVLRGGPDACWFWTGARSSDGYGYIRADRCGPLLAAHRVSFQLHVRDLEPGEAVLHACDYPGCVNPRHLVAGTQAVNILDFYRKRARRAWRPTDPRTIRANVTWLQQQSTG